MILFLSCDPELQPDQKEVKHGIQYFPLAVGNNWVYSTHSTFFDDQTLESELIDQLDTLTILKDTTVNSIDYFYFNRGYWMFEEGGAFYEQSGTPGSINAFPRCVLDTTRLSHWNTARVVLIPGPCSSGNYSYYLEYHNITLLPVDQFEIAGGHQQIRDSIELDFIECSSVITTDGDGSGRPSDLIYYAQGIGCIRREAVDLFNSTFSTELIAYQLN